MSQPERPCHWCGSAVEDGAGSVRRVLVFVASPGRRFPRNFMRWVTECAVCCESVEGMRRMEEARRK